MVTQLKESGILITLTTGIQVPPRKNRESNPRTANENVVIYLWGYSWEFVVVVYRPVLQILTLFRTKKCNFPHPFSDQISRFHTCFQTWPLGRNYVTLIRLQRKQKKFFKSVSNSHISLSYSFGIDMINTFIHSRSSLKNHTRDQTGQSVHPFSDQKGAKT